MRAGDIRRDKDTMMRLLTVLRRHSVPLDALGGRRTMDREALRRDLARLQSHLRTLLWSAATMVAIVFVLEVSVAWAHVQNPTVLGGIAAAIGMTVGGAITGMRAIAREMAEVGLIVALAGELTAEQMSQVVGVLARRGTRVEPRNDPRASRSGHTAMQSRTRTGSTQGRDL